VLDWIDNTTHQERGVYNLYGGNLNIANLYVRPTGSIDIQHGIMTVAGDMTWYIRDLIAGSQIKAYGGQGTVMYDYGITNPGKTTVWAIPEPATIILLGAGLTVLTSRKKKSAN
jgi:hypothetical protein